MLSAKRCLLPAVSICIVIGFAGAARADESQKVFDDLFGAKVKAAAASADRADDLAVAQELLKSGDLVLQQPKLLALLCDHAYDLTKKDAAGFATAIDAMTLLAKHVPERGAEAAEKIMDISQRQFNAAKTDEKAAAGEALIDALLAHADAQMKAKAFSDAAGSYRRALSTARLIKSARHDAIKTTLDEAVEREMLAAKLTKLQADLAAKPNDPAAPRELILLNIIELDDPVEASTFIAVAKDETLSKRVLLAGKPLTDIKDADALDLGEWYRGLADQTAAPLAKRKMLTRSSTYLKHYLALKTTTDLTTTKAQLMASAVTAVLDKLGGPVEVSIPQPAATVAAVAPTTGNDAPLTDLSAFKPIATFTAPDQSAGLEVVEIAGESAYSTGTMAGKPALVMEGIHFGLKLDDAIARDIAPDTDRWFLRFTVLDRMAGYIGAGYDGQKFTFPNNGDGTFTQTPWHQIRGTGQWVTVDLELPQARFNNRMQKDTDLRVIIGANMKPAYIHKVELFRIKLPPRADRVLKPGQSVDLLKLIAPSIDALHGSWELTADGLRCKPTVFARTGIPLNVTGSYEMKVEFARTGGRESVNIVLPIGDHHVALVLDGYAGRGFASGLETINGKLAVDNATAATGPRLTNDKPHTADVRVKVAESGQGEIEVDLDGQSLVRWSGPLALFTGSAWRMPEPTRLGFGAFNVGAHIKSAKLKLIDGEALFLTSGATIKSALLNGGAGGIDNPPADSVPLASLNEKVEFAAAFGKPTRMGNMRFIRMSGTDLQNSLAIMPAPDKPAHLSYDIAGKYRTFIGAIGINDVAKEPASDLTFSIVGDGKELWKSQPTRNRAKVQPFQVDVTGVKKLELFVACSGKNAYCNSLWVEPMLYTKAVKLNELNKSGPGAGKGFFGLPTE